MRMDRYGEGTWADTMILYKLLKRMISRSNCKIEADEQAIMDKYSIHRCKIKNDMWLCVGEEMLCNTRLVLDGYRQLRFKTQIYRVNLCDMALKISTRRQNRPAVWDYDKVDAFMFDCEKKYGKRVDYHGILSKRSERYKELNRLLKKRKVGQELIYDAYDDMMRRYKSAFEDYNRSMEMIRRRVDEDNQDVIDFMEREMRPRTA